MAAVTIYSDFGAQEEEIFPLGHCYFLKFDDVISEVMTQKVIKNSKWKLSVDNPTLNFGGALKSLHMVTAAMKLKDAYSLEGKLWPT